MQESVAERLNKANTRVAAVKNLRRFNMFKNDFNPADSLNVYNAQKNGQSTAVS